MDRATIKLFFTALFISGIPVFSSGLPQPSDIIMMFLGVYFFINNAEETFLNNYFLIAFIFYTLVINMTYIILLSDTSFLPSLFYYPFCLMIYILARNIKFGEKTITYLRICYITLGFTLLIINILFPTLSSRQELLFNNPNQLGYWALSMIIIYLYLFKSIKGTDFNFLDLLVIFLFTYFTIASLSKAAIASLIFFYIVFILQNFTLRKIILPFFITLVVLYGFSKTKVYEDFLTRMSQFTEENDSTIKSRGYYRILDSPQYLYFGSGQGGYGRFFKLSEHVIEIHSSIGTVIFSYGLIGLILFCLMIASMTDWKNFFIYLIPLFLYSLTHEGLRETNFWLILGFFSNQSLKKGTSSSTNALTH